MIFLAYLPTGPSTPQMALMYTPLVFWRICSDWRTQAWSMPWLWNEISVYFSSQCTPMVSVLLEEWLVISGDYPLSINLTDNARYGPEIDVRGPNTQQLLRLLPNLARWQSITFNIMSSRLQGFRCIHGRLPRLASITLLIIDCPDVVDDTFQLFSVAPRLQRIKTYGTVNWNESIFPMRQLTCLSMYSPDIGRCLDVLRNCPLLVNGSFSAVCPSVVSLPSPMTLPVEVTHALRLYQGGLLI
jgi:hypothetical protein